MDNTETSTTMTNAQPNTLVLKDQEGNYFLVSRAAVEQGRVPAERRGEIERLVAEAGAQDDVSGHAIMIGGLWFAPPAEDGNPAVPPTRVGVDGPSFDPPRLPRQPRVE